MAHISQIAASCVFMHLTHLPRGESGEVHTCHSWLSDDLMRLRIKNVKVFLLHADSVQVSLHVSAHNPVQEDMYCAAKTL